MIPGAAPLQADHPDAIALNHQSRPLVNTDADLIREADDRPAYSLLALAAREVRIDNRVGVQRETVTVLDFLVAAFDHHIRHDRRTGRGTGDDAAAGQHPIDS